LDLLADCRASLHSVRRVLVALLVHSAEPANDSTVVIMNTSVPSGMEWVAPWEPILDGAALNAELRAEIVAGHPLHGLAAAAVGRRTDCDDVLFCVDHPLCTLAVVHLTWRGRPEPDPTWPHTRLFADWAEWIEKCLKPDHAQYEEEGG
jgi:hypothetical protein